MESNPLPPSDELVRARQRKNALLRVIPDLIFLMDIDGKYHDFRGGNGRVFINQETIIGSYIQDSGIPADVVAQILAHNRAAIETGEVQTLDYALPFADGEVHYYESRSVRYDNNRAVRIVRDVTERKRLEIEQEKYIRKLEVFAFIVSHELRQPVANIMGLASLFQLELMPQEERQFVEKIGMAAQQLDEIIHRLNKAIEE